MTSLAHAWAEAEGHPHSMPLKRAPRGVDVGRIPPKVMGDGLSASGYWLMLFFAVLPSCRLAVLPSCRLAVLPSLLPTYRLPAPDSPYWHTQVLFFPSDHIHPAALALAQGS